MSNNNNNNKETESPDIIEDIIPGKNKDNNNRPSFNKKYDLKQSAQSVIKDFKEPEIYRERNNNTNETRNQVPYYAQVITDMREQADQTTQKMTENYMEYQKQALNSFQSVFMPYFENVNYQLWNNQEFFKRLPEMYSMMTRIYAENLIAFGRFFNDAVFSNIGFFNNSFKEAKE